MIQTAQVEVLVYTFYPYTANKCQRADPVLVNQFDGRQWMQSGSMFPDKLGQMHGCPLTVLTWHQPPFVALHWDPQSEEMKASGFEIQLLEYMSQQMNFSVHLSNLSLLRPEKYLLAEGVAEGPLEMVRSPLLPKDTICMYTVCPFTASSAPRQPELGIFPSDGSPE